MSGSRSKLPIAALAALLLATAGFFTYLLREAAAKDDAAPVIVCSSSEIHVSVDASEEELLFGVTAMDAEDGDITSSVVIESISSFVEPGKSIITYAALIRITMLQRPHALFITPIIIRRGFASPIRCNFYPERLSILCCISRPRTALTAIFPTKFQ